MCVWGVSEQAEDTGLFAVLIDYDDVCEIPLFSLGDDFL